jgi:hypothetical protein
MFRYCLAFGLGFFVSCFVRFPFASSYAGSLVGSLVFLCRRVVSPWFEGLYCRFLLEYDF